MTSNTILPADDLWNVRQNLMAMFDDRCYNPHPDLFISQVDFYGMYRKELETADCSKIFLQSMHFVIHKNTSVKHIQHAYVPPPFIIKIQEDSSLKGDDDQCMSDAMNIPTTATCKVSLPDDTVLVIYFKEASIGIETIRTLNRYIQLVSATHVLCVCHGKFNSMALRVLKNENTNIRLQTIQVMQLGHIPTQHVYNPFLKSLSKQEADQFYEDNHLRPEQIPIYFHDDPLVEWYGFLPGELIEIKRRSALFQPEYRLVRAEYNSANVNRSDSQKEEDIDRSAD
jgi:DNA-directed RNA polymerase subunit H (RpoH/RPB5)